MRHGNNENGGQKVLGLVTLTAIRHSVAGKRESELDWEALICLHYRMVDVARRGQILCEEIEAQIHNARSGLAKLKKLASRPPAAGSFPLARLLKICARRPAGAITRPTAAMELCCP